MLGRVHARRPQRGRPAPRGGARPALLVITNYARRPERELCQFIANHPLEPQARQARETCPSRARLWIEREDFMEEPVKGYRLASIRATWCACATASSSAAPAAEGRRRQVTAVLADMPCPTPSPARPAPTTARSRAACTGSRWRTVFAAPECRIYDRLFAHPIPARAAGDRTSSERLPRRHQPGQQGASSPPAGAPLGRPAEDRFRSSSASATATSSPTAWISKRPGAPVFNRTTLKDSWVADGRAGPGSKRSPHASFARGDIRP